MTDPEDPVESALARMQVRSPEVARLAREALEWMTGCEGLDNLNLRGLVHFLGYQLPEKWDLDLAGNRQVVAALGELLERLELPRYAEQCRADLVDELLVAHAQGDTPSVHSLYERLTDRSGVEPPDTLLFSWGSVMGPVEVDAKWSTAAMLELALQAGEFAVGERGCRRTSERLTDEHLLRERPELGGSWWSRIRQERLEYWARSFGGSECGELTAAFADLCRPGLDLIDEELPVPALAEVSLAPLHWLLDHAEQGAPLTATFALKPVLVREFCDRFADRVMFPGSREIDVHELGDFRELAEDLGAVRRRGATLFRTERGRMLVEEPPTLWVRVAAQLLTGSDGEAAAAEICLLLLLMQPALDARAVDQRVAEALAANGWRLRQDGGGPSPTDAAVLLGRLRRRLRLLDLIEPGTALRRDELNEAGRSAAFAALRARALGPRHSIF